MTRLSFVCSIVLAVAVAAQTEGPMRGVLTTPGGDLPFVMTAILGPYRILHGGHEQRVAWRQAAKAPPYFIDFPPYDSWLEHGEMENGMQLDGAYRGKWTKVGPKGEVSLPFRWEYWPMVADPAEPNRLLRGPLFPLAGEPWDPSGRWSVQFAQDTHPAVAILGNRSDRMAGAGEIQGTILTTTGDYRWLAGTARGDELRLSCFDGAHAFLFAAKRQPDGSLTGDFWSGAAWHEPWVARRDAKAELPDPFTLTKVRDGKGLGELAYADAATGAPRRLQDLCGTVTLVVLFGTWCPNCSDAGPFLRELQQQFGERGLRVIGLAFEHGEDPERHRRLIAAYRAQHGVTWPILLAGSSDKQAASVAFPALDAVRAYPTTLFVDGAGAIRSVHQGFAGPATGAAHAAQRQSFENLIGRLLEEAGNLPKKR